MLDNVNVLYLDDENVCRPVLKNKPQLCFCLKNIFEFIVPTR